MSIGAAELMNQLNLTSQAVAADDDESKAKPSDSNGKSRDGGNLTTFPWVPTILRMCREAVGTKDTKCLDGLLYALVKELSVSIKDCYSRPNRASKLRNIVSELLAYLDMVYQDLRAEYGDNNNGTYLRLMTDILAIYLDLEIKASKRGIHSLKKIGQFMTTALYMHLDNSEDHMIEAVLKAKLITKSAGELCAPVLLKLLSNSTCFIGDENAYVRYLLAFKLLHKITLRPDRGVIVNMALKKLDPAPELVNSVRKLNIFPIGNLPDKQITSFLMNASFDFIKAKREYLRTSDLSNGNLFDFSYKSFTYDNQLSESVTQLLKKNTKAGQDISSGVSWSENSNQSKNCSTDYDLDPSLYKLSSKNSPGEQGKSNDDVEFLGTHNKAEKPVVVITLDSDEESQDVLQLKKESQESNELLNSTVEVEKIAVEAAIPAAATAKQQSKSEGTETEKCVVEETTKLMERKEETCNKIKKVPDKEVIPKMVNQKENCSTIHVGGIPPRLQSPEHGVIDSTSNIIDSTSDETLLSPKRGTYEIHSNTMWDDGRTEVSSSLDVINSTAGKLIDDSEISSTRRTARDVDPKPSRSLSETSEMTDIDKNGERSETTKTCHKNVYERLVIIHNYSVLKSQTSSKEDESRPHSSDVSCESSSSSSTLQLVDSPVIQKAHTKSSVKFSGSRNQNKSDLKHTIHKEKVDSLFEKSVPVIECKSSVKDSRRDPNRDFKHSEVHSSKSKHHSETRSPLSDPVAEKKAKVQENSGNSSLNVLLPKLESVISNSTKKVNYENVAKSYKIVKSKSLKTESTHLSPPSNRTSDKSSDRSSHKHKSPPKFIKLEKGGVIGNISRLEEKTRGTSKSHEMKVPSDTSSRVGKSDAGKSSQSRKDEHRRSRTSSTSSSSKSSSSTTSASTHRSHHEKSDRTSVVGSASPRTHRTNQSVPIIFKISEEPSRKPSPSKSRTSYNERRGHSSSRKAESSSRTSGSSSSSSKSRRSHKSRSKTVIKTDINMHSTLKTINPSSIPQFNGGVVVKDRKRKHKEESKESHKGEKAPRVTIATDTPHTSAKKGIEDVGNTGFRVQVNYPNISKDIFGGTISTKTTSPSDEQIPSSFYPERVILPNFKVQDSEMHSGIDHTKPHPLPCHTFFVDVQIPTSLNALRSPEIPVANKLEPVKNVLTTESESTYCHSVVTCDSLNTTPPVDESHLLSSLDEMKYFIESGADAIPDPESGYDSHGRSSSMEVGMTFSNLMCTGKTSGVPRDMIISEGSEEDLKQEELGDLGEPWEGPRDYFPDDEEYILRSLPDPQNLFSEEDFLTHFLDGPFSPSNLNLDVGGSFSEKCLYDEGSDHELDGPIFETAFNENFFSESVSQIVSRHQGRFPDGEASVAPGIADESPNGSDGGLGDPPKTRNKKGSDGRSGEKERRKTTTKATEATAKGGSISSKRKATTGSGSRMKNKSGIIVTETSPTPSEKVDKKKLRSDSVAYHTRSLSQKGIPIEFTAAPPKKVKKSKKRNS